MKHDMIALVAWTGPVTAQPGATGVGDSPISHQPRSIVTTDLGADPDE